MMPTLCLVRLLPFGVPNLFLPNSFHALQDYSRIYADEIVLILLLREMKANIMEQGLLALFSDCEVDPVWSLSAFIWANEIAWTDSEASGCHL